MSGPGLAFPKPHTLHRDHDRFSPDGKWVVSGGEDGLVKLWDLTAGKLLYEYQHEGPVTSMDLHPSELLLASGSMDRTVRDDPQSYAPRSVTCNLHRHTQ